MEKLDNTGIQLNIYTHNVIELIDSLCDWVLEFRIKLKKLIETFLTFLEGNNYNDSEIAKQTLRMYKDYFRNI